MATQTLPNIGDKLAKAIDAEIKRANRHGETFLTLHDAYAVILEEVDEVWDICKQKKRVRSKPALRSELIQVAAMAIKALKSLDNFTGGKV